MALSGLTRAFAGWLRQASDAQPPDRSRDAERLRRALGAVARKLVADGLQRGETSRSWWSVELRVEWAGGAPRAKLLSLGDWRPVPARYGLAPLLERLRAMARHPGLRRCQVAILKEGLVSVDDDRELVLEAPRRGG